MLVAIDIDLVLTQVTMGLGNVCIVVTMMIALASILVCLSVCPLELSRIAAFF